MGARLLVWVILLAGCRPDDVKTDDSAATDDSGLTDDSGADDTADSGTGDDASSLYGTWVSEGDNLAPAFVDPDAASTISKVTATFSADGSYVVSAKVDGVARAFDFEGTWTADMSTSPHGIVLNQATLNGAAKVLTSAGIWLVEASTLTYEAIQTDPDAGCSPPTAAGGFGSTTCSPEVEAGYYVQVYLLSE